MEAGAWNVRAKAGKGFSAGQDVFP